jgi:predicted kinase
VPETPVVVVVTGPPASGKSTIAAGLRDFLGYPLVAKDDLKEALAGPLEIEGRDQSRMLGSAVYAAMNMLVRELTDANVSLIVEGNFSSDDTFTGVRARFVQVHVSAPLDLIRERLESRTDRHPVHYDAEAADEILTRAARGDWGPLDLDGPLLRADTSTEVDLEALARDVGAGTS